MGGAIFVAFTDRLRCGTLDRTIQVPPRCGNSRGRGPVGISYGARATLPDRRRCTNAAKHLRCLRRQEEPTMSSTEVMPDLLVVAALERAERHSTPGRVGVPGGQPCTSTSDLPRRSAARPTRPRARLAGLESAGVWTQAAPARRPGLDADARRPPTPGTGAARGHDPRAARVAAASGVARGADRAEDEVDRFQQRRRTQSDRRVPSSQRPHDAIGRLARLRGTVVRLAPFLGSATYCLYEWAEPNDATR